jgi:myosin protein heavy chain
VEQRQTRAGKKRRLSDASNASDRPSSSQSFNASIASTPAKRRKRAKAPVAGEPEVILEEEEAEADLLGANGSRVSPACEGGAIVEDLETVEVFEKHVHFPPGRNSQTIALNDDDTNDKNTATHITPHPHKFTLKRRTTTSPTTGTGAVETVQRHTISSTRHSLPPSLSQNGEVNNIVIEHHMAPLSEVLEERVQQRMQLAASRQARIKELEAQKVDADPETLAAINADINQLREQNKYSYREALGREEDSKLDSDMMVLDSQQEFAYPELPKDSTQIDFEEVKVRHSLSQSFSQSSNRRTREEAWEEERQQFHNAILTLSEEANEAKTQLQILEIELNALGLGDGADTKTVLSSIRESFALVRERLEEVLPGTVPSDASNADLLEILLANVEEFAGRLRTQDHELYEKSNLVASLGSQVQGLLDHLADAKIREEKLEKVKGEIDRSLESKERDLEEVDQGLAEAEDEIDALKDEIVTKSTRVDELEKERGTLTLDVEKLKTALEGYRSEETRLHDLITKMEQEHASTIEKMHQERDETVHGLEDHLAEEKRARAEAEELAEERQARISDLEKLKETIEQERENLRDQLEDMTNQRDDEREAHDAAEADLETRTVEVEDLSDRVSTLEADLEEVNVQISELRQLNETERNQREAAETDLDNAQNDIDELNKKLQTQGAQANELRQKLWEVQQSNEVKAKELEKAASEREQQYQEDIQQEVERRQDAEVVIQTRDATIEDLTARLDELEQNMKEALGERDDKIDALEQELTEREGEIEQLNRDLEHTQDLYDAKVSESNKQREEYEGSIDALQATIASHESAISTLQTESISDSALHASEIEDRNARIAELNHEVAELAEQIRDLQAKNAGLERRVEEEAEQMLQLQADKEDQIDGLNAIIKDKMTKIQVVEQKAREADARWQEVLAGRQDEIHLLQTQQSSSEETITSLTTEIETMKHRFRDYIRRTTGKITNLQHLLAQAQAAADQDGLDIIKEGEEMADQFDSMATSSAMISTKNMTATHSSDAANKRTRSKKKRVVDSGIGMDEESSMFTS